MAILFSVAIALLIYTYLGYPLAMGLLARALPPRRHPVDPDLRPAVTVLIAAYNEEQHIGARLQNLEGLRYPKEKLQVLVGSDGSTDATVAMARESGLSQLDVVEFTERRGKAAVLNRLAERCDSEVLAFTDANTIWAPDALERLVAHFADERVGGVAGRLRLRSASVETSVESQYWNIESWLKEQESRLATTIGANGAIYAIRRNLWQPLPVDRPVMDDFVVGCRVVEAGYRLLFEPAAVAYEPTTGRLEQEMRRKRRIFVANFCAVPVLWRMLLRPVPAVLYTSHKLLRWGTPLLLIALAIGAIRLRTTMVGAVLLAGLGVAVAGAIAYRIGLKWRPLGVLYYGARLQSELFRAMFVAALTKPAAAWERSDRSTGSGARTAKLEESP